MQVDAVDLVAAMLGRMAAFRGAEVSGHTLSLFAERLLAEGCQVADIRRVCLQLEVTVRAAGEPAFPALGTWLRLLGAGTLDVDAAAHLAWTTFEQSLRRAGAYRGATFVDGAIGETARQVVGSWPAACAFDVDSPGWAIRRQSFLAVYPTFHGRVSGPVTLGGLHAHETPVVIGHVEGLPLLDAAPEEDRELTTAEATAALTRVRDRVLARTRAEAS